MDHSFGNWLKRRRKALDLTQQDLAQRVGCSISLIFKIESDERRPSRQITEILAKQLEIPPVQRELFMKVARQEVSIEALTSIPQLSGVVSALDLGPVPLTLPVTLTSLIGREPELQVLIQQLQDPACRLLTLTGPGGVGKTRLALEAAYRVREMFKHGTFFVSLVGTSAAEFIVPAIAEEIRFVFSGPTKLKEQLFNFLKDKHILVVLDNLEHLLNGIELLDELLEHAPQVKLLTTSREQLNLRAEWVFEVQGLPVPAKIEINNLESNSAAALFVQRARQTDVNFMPHHKDLRTITRICQLVEGLPLALELAATWVRAMSLIEIAREIERNIDFLATTARNLPERHRSIRAVFDYSWNLLASDERLAMRCLAVFRGGFQREAAEAVAGAGLPLLSALVGKSLVRRNESGRYDIHELLRQYVAAQLQKDSQEEQEVRRRHAEFYLSLLSTRKTMLQSRRQQAALSMLIPETDNIRAAWDVAISDRRLDLIREAVWSLWYMYELRTYFQEGETLIKRSVSMTRELLAETDSQNSSPEKNRRRGALGAFLAHEAFFSFRLGRNIESQELYQESIALLRPLDEPTLLAYALGHYGILRSLQGAYEDAALNVREAIELSNSADDRWQLALSTTFLGMVVDDQGDYPEAYRLLTEALQIARSLGDPRLISLAAGYLGQTAQTLGQVEQVPELLREGLQAAAETNDRFGIALAGVRMAMAAQARGNGTEARRLLKESITHFHDAGDTWFLAHALNLEGKLAFAAGEFVQAEESFKAAGKIAFAAQAYPMLLDVLAGVAMLDAQTDHHERALMAVMHILTNPSSTQGTKNRANQLLSELESNFTPQQIGAARSRAQSIPLVSLAHELMRL